MIGIYNMGVWLCRARKCSFHVFPIFQLIDLPAFKLRQNQGLYYICLKFEVAGLFDLSTLCPFVFLSFCLFVLSSFCPFVFLSFRLFVFSSFRPFVFSSFCLFVLLSFCPFVLLSFRLFVFSSFCLFVFPNPPPAPTPSDTVLPDERCLPDGRRAGSSGAARVPGALRGSQLTGQWHGTAACQRPGSS